MLQLHLRLWKWRELVRGPSTLSDMCAHAVSINKQSQLLHAIHFNSPPELLLSVAPAFAVLSFALQVQCLAGRAIQQLLFL